MVQWVQVSFGDNENVLEFIVYNFVNILKVTELYTLKG